MISGILSRIQRRRSARKTQNLFSKVVFNQQLFLLLDHSTSLSFEPPEHQNDKENGVCAFWGRGHVTLSHVKILALICYAEAMKNLHFYGLHTCKGLVCPYKCIEMFPENVNVCLIVAFISLLYRFNAMQIKSALQSRDS